MVNGSNGADDEYQISNKLTIINVTRNEEVEARDLFAKSKKSETFFLVIMIKKNMQKTI